MNYKLQNFFVYLFTRSLVYLLAILVCFSCKNTESATKVALSKVEKHERIYQIANQGIDYETIYASLRLGFKSGKKEKSASVNAHLSIKKNEAIQLSLRVPLVGWEVARIVITPEKMLIVDRKNKQYFLESMTTIKDELPFDFDFYNLQALFTNHFFIAGKPEISSTDFNDFRLTEDEYYVYLNSKDSQGINYDFQSDYTSRILKTEIYKNKNKTNIVWEYNNFDQISDKRIFPMKMQMAIHLPKDLVEMTFDFSSVDTNKSFVPEINAPAKYKRISLEQVTKLIKSL